MSTYQERFETYKTAIGRDIPPIFQELVAKAGLDAAQQQQVGEALGVAYMCGIEAGETELLAVAERQGHALDVERIPSTDQL
ncbi:hypothetical protein [Patulibacter minatonensis]|uniref:hypothetical protein n=1 Tax=Patulibacter minatonensis TaxID=298163 RepID=UPI00047CCFAB|nr:hypothetical protein [Patulibacter minatonensis]